MELVIMTLPLLAYRPTTQNHRVRNFGRAELNEDSPRIYRLEDVGSADEMSGLIWAAYRQIFSEHVLLKSCRQVTLESQLKNRAITVRDFIRGLAQSDPFYRLVVAVNNNYRLVDVCLRRILGRQAYNQSETIAWSIRIATQGVQWLCQRIGGQRRIHGKFRGSNRTLPTPPHGRSSLQFGHPPLRQ
jgi:phycobilisome rod-core linker protein